MDKHLPKLFGIIAVAFKGNRTFYVRRSRKMENYPEVWSLPSIQYDPKKLQDVYDLRRVQPYLNRISKERLKGTPIVAKEFLTSGDSNDNPIGKHVFLSLYNVEFLGEPRLNMDYYTDAAWMTAEEYEKISAGHPCGLCLRLWSDYAWLAGFVDRPFVPTKVENAA